MQMKYRNGFMLVRVFIYFLLGIPWFFMLLLGAKSVKSVGNGSLWASAFLWCFLIVLPLWRRRHNQPGQRISIVPEYKPPASITPTEETAMALRGVDDNVLHAAIEELVQLELVHPVASIKEALHSKEKCDHSFGGFYRTSKPATGLNSYQDYLINWMFPARRDASGLDEPDDIAEYMFTGFRGSVLNHLHGRGWIKDIPTAAPPPRNATEELVRWWIPPFLGTGFLIGAILKNEHGFLYRYPLAGWIAVVGLLPAFNASRRLVVSAVFARTSEWTHWLFHWKGYIEYRRRTREAEREGTITPRRPFQFFTVLSSIFPWWKFWTGLAIIVGAYCLSDLKGFDVALTIFASLITAYLVYLSYPDERQREGFDAIYDVSPSAWHKHDIANSTSKLSISFIIRSLRHRMWKTCAGLALFLGACHFAIGSRTTVLVWALLITGY